MKKPGSIYFVTLKTVNCIRSNEFMKPHPHVLAKNHVWKMTSPIYLENGDLKFHLYDYQGYIGTYIIPHFFLAFIEEATKKQYKNACHF